jgi:DNA-binding beta-propeller fold protein YncE
VLSGGGEYKQNVTLSHWSIGLFVDALGYIYVTDNRKHAVYVYDPSWSIKQTLGKHGSCTGCLYAPNAVSVNNDNGDILVADELNHRVQVFRKL